MKKLTVVIIVFITLIFVKDLFWLLGMDPLFNLIGDGLLITIFSVVSYRFYKTLISVNVDDLTGTYNRKFFFEELKKEVERAKRQENFLSLCMFDFDDFKRINDGYGHFIGDKVLREFSEIVLNNIREYDVFGRLGGEEFALLIEDNSKNYSYEVCERIRKKVEENIFESNVCITISIGIARWNDCDNIDTLYEKADNAMYESKNKGKNTTTVWKNGLIRDGTTRTCRED